MSNIILRLFELLFDRHSTYVCQQQRGQSLLAVQYQVRAVCSRASQRLTTLIVRYRHRHDKLPRLQRIHHSLHVVLIPHKASLILWQVYIPCKHQIQPVPQRVFPIIHPRIHIPFLHFTHSRFTSSFTALYPKWKDQTVLP